VAHIGKETAFGLGRLVQLLDSAIQFGVEIGQRLETQLFEHDPSKHHYGDGHRHRIERETATFGRQRKSERAQHQNGERQNQLARTGSIETTHQTKIPTR
jgi:hypothetical protein